MIDLKINNCYRRERLPRHASRQEAQGRTRCQNAFIADLPEYVLRDLESIHRIQRPEPRHCHPHGIYGGGIGVNQANPGKFFCDNTIMGIQLIHESCMRKIEKYVVLGTICCYLKHTPVSFKEENLWNGYQEEINAPYGLVRKCCKSSLKSEELP